MKKVNCVVIYSNTPTYFTLHNITVKHKNENITLYNDQWDNIDRKHAYKYELFNDLYGTVLAFLKSNNFYVSSWKDFGTTWYNIDFINLQNNMIDRYSYKKEKKQ